MFNGVFYMDVLSFSGQTSLLLRVFGFFYERGPRQAVSRDVSLRKNMSAYCTRILIKRLGVFFGFLTVLAFLRVFCGFRVGKFYGVVLFSSSDVGISLGLRVFK